MLGDNYPKWIFDKKKEEYTPEEALNILSRAKMYDHIKNCIKNNGLEGTEDMIKKNYNTVPKLQRKMLNILYGIWKC